MDFIMQHPALHVVFGEAPGMGLVHANSRKKSEMGRHTVSIERMTGSGRKRVLKRVFKRALPSLNASVKGDFQATA